MIGEKYMVYNLKNISIIIQLITNGLVIIGGIIGIWQYRASKKQELYHYDKERIHLAIEIAEYYKENILAYSRNLKQIIENLGILDIVEGVDLKEIEFFDIIEHKQVYSKKNLNKIINTRIKYNIDRNVNEKSISYRSTTKEEYKHKGKCMNEKIGQEYVDLMFIILNNLEIFSMYFVHGTADESVVYQPLHMSYLEIVRLLYYDISYANRNGENKFYINTIKLFNIWKDKALKMRERETTIVRSIPEEGNILQKIK